MHNQGPNRLKIQTCLRPCTSLDPTFLPSNLDAENIAIGFFILLRVYLASFRLYIIAIESTYNAIESLQSIFSKKTPHVYTMFKKQLYELSSIFF